MSSYLSFYLVPKKTRKKYNYDNDNGSTETEEEISKGLPLLFTSYSRGNDVYRAYYETLNPAYAGMEEKYTELTHEDAKRVADDWKKEIESIEERLQIDYKMLKEGGYSSELWEDIHSMEKYLTEQKETYEELLNISNFVYECTNKWNDFEKVLVNVD